MFLDLLFDATRENGIYGRELDTNYYAKAVFWFWRHKWFKTWARAEEFFKKFRRLARHFGGILLTVLYAIGIGRVLSKKKKEKYKHRH